MTKLFSPVPECLKTRLWQVNLQNSKLPEAFQQAYYGAIGSVSPAELVAFAHATLFSPALSTLYAALKAGFLTNFPGLTTATLRKYPPRSVAMMIKGHLDQTHKNQQSTQPKKLPPIDTAHPSNTSPTSDTPNARSHICYAAIMEPTGQIYTDQTGRFVVVPSSNGNNYVLILYDYDSNATITEPMQSRPGANILDAYKTAPLQLCNAGLRPQLHRLDNECSIVLKQFLRDKAIDFQLVPPGIHRRNAAERAIRTFKNHFIAGPSSVDKDFQLHLWDRLRPQAGLTLNLL
jgi:hypothetical protein